MYGVEALPLLHSFSRSDSANERALFVRVYLDLLTAHARRGPIGGEWLDAWDACLSKASAAERAGYLADLAKVRPRELADAPPAFATRDEIDAIVRQGRPDRLIALAAERRARLRSDHIESLVAHALSLARAGDRRLVDAVLSREPIRLEAAPLFLEATPEQRRAILLAAQRAVLDRKPWASAPRLDEATASRLEFAAIAGDDREFAAALGAALGADPDLAARIAADPTGEPLAVALAALSAPRDVAVRIMTARDMQAGPGFPRIATLARLSERVSAAAARRIIAALVNPSYAADATPAPPAAAPRQPPHPSPFLRREGAPRASASPERSVRPARNSQRP